MFTDPSSGDICNPRDVDGHLIIVRPVELRPDVPTTNYGAKDAIEIDICDLDDTDPATNQPGRVYRSSLWFNTPLIGSLRNSIGQLVLARMGQGQAKPGQSAPWVLTSVPDVADKQRAEQWINTHPSFVTRQLTAPNPASAAAPAPPAAAAPVTAPTGGQTVELTPETAALLKQLQAQQI